VCAVCAPKEEIAMTDDKKFKAEVLEWILRYIALGWAIFRLYTVDEEGQCTCGDRACPNPGKHPFKGTRGFKDATTDEATVRSWCGPDAPPFNPAIAAGAASGVTVADIDCGSGKVGMQTWMELTREKGEPQTLIATTGGGGSHVFFQYTAALKTGNNRLGKHVDVKNDGGYVVAAPSRHRSGDAYEWENWGVALATVPPYLMPHKWEKKPKQSRKQDRPPSSTLDEVKDMLTKVPPDNRDTWRHIGIILGREFPDDDEAYAAYHEWADTWGGPKDAKHDQTMHECFYVLAKQEANRKLTMGTLVKLARENGWVPKCIAELNQSYAVVWMGGDCVILREHTAPDTGLLDVSFCTKGAVKLFHAAAPKVGGVDRVEYWLKHPAHRKYDGLVFQPGPGPYSASYYNLWRGFSVEPKKGDCSLYLTHIKENITSGNEMHYRYLLAWMANIVQNPGHRPGVAVVMRSGQGTGKGILAKGFGRLFRPHFAHITNSRQLVGHFNALLKQAIVVYADEAFWAGDRQAEGTLNALITEDTHNIELKGIDPIVVTNYMHLLIASNHDWVIPAASEARRFFVLDVGEKHMQDHAYFKAIDTQMKNGGSAALLYDLLEYDYSGVDLWTVPKTQALDDQKVHSMTPMERFWFGCLKAGSQMGRHREGFSSGDGRWGGIYENDWGWETGVGAAELYEEYIRRSQQAGVTRRAMEMELAAALKGMVPGVRHGRFTMAEGKAQVRAWIFPPLKECREAFDQYMKWTYPWEDDQADTGNEVGSSQTPA
jgi:hypothetical protein